MALGSVDLIADQAQSRSASGPRPNLTATTSGLGAAQTPAPRSGGGYYGVGNYNPSQGGYTTPNGLNGGARSQYGNLFGQYAPDFQNFQTQGRLLRNQYDMLMGNFGADRGDLRQQYGLDMAGLGLDRQGLGISSDAARRGIRNTRAEERIARQLLANAQGQANSDAGNAVVRSDSEAIANGGFSAPGMRFNRGEIYGNLVMERERNQLGFDRDLLGIREQRASHRDTLRNIGLEAQRLGLREDELQMGLRTGLRNLRLDTSMSVNDIMSALSSNNAQRAALARQILQSALGTIGL